MWHVMTCDEEVTFYCILLWFQHTAHNIMYQLILSYIVPWRGQCFHLGFCNNSSFELYRIKLFKFLNFIGKYISHVELYRIKLFKLLIKINLPYTNIHRYIPLNTSNIRSNHMCSFKIQFSCNSFSQNMHLNIVPSWLITKNTFLIKSFNTKHTLYLYYPNGILLSIYILLFPSLTLF